MIYNSRAAPITQRKSEGQTMRGLLDKLKNYVIYDADKDFYARVFPDSVMRLDLL